MSIPTPENPASPALEGENESKSPTAPALAGQSPKVTEEEVLAAKKALEKRTEELAYALAVMQATLQSTNDGIVAADISGRITSLNSKCEEILAVTSELRAEGRVQKIWEFAARRFKEPDRFLTRTREIQSSTVASFDLLELADGRFYERYSRVLLIEGRPVGRVWNFRDVTERHNAYISSRRLAAIVDSSDDAIISKDLHNMVVSWNAAAERMYGYAAEEMIGASIMRLVPPERHREEEELLSRIRAGERLEHFETQRLIKDGRRLDVSITFSPIRDAIGNIVGVSKISRDITERKLSEAALRKAKEAEEAANQERLKLLESERAARAEAERANQMKDEFLATLSHELRTPLNAVLGWANLLRTAKFQDEELTAGLETIERNARAQAQIIEDLLDMSRITSGKVRLEIQHVNLGSVLQDAIETVRAAANAKEIQLQTVIDGEAPPVSGDPNRLQQIFWNLLSNAIKFTPKGGRVQIALGRVDSYLEVRVSDTGEGISPEFLPYVFNRFQQADGSTTRRHGGLGLGLSIVKQLTELHGGTVEAASSGSGHGASFVVRIPVLAVYSAEKSLTDSRVTAAEAAISAEASLAKVRILVVDDEPDARHVVKRLLERAGAEVSVAGSAEEGMSCISNEPVDVLVSDIGMPEEDGYSFIKRVRALGEARGHFLPAVALTAYARSEERAKAIRSGFQNHLAKPVEAAELLAVIRQLAGPLCA